MTIRITIILVFLLLLLPSFSWCDTQSIELQNGFNFVTVTLQPDNGVTSSGLFNASSLVTQIFRFDSTTQNFVFQLRLENGSLFGTDFPLQEGVGYVIKCSNSTSVAIVGTSSSGTDSRQTVTGFNFMGFAPLVEGPTASSLFAAHSELKSIFRWVPENSGFSFIIKLDSGSLFGEDFTLQDGKAYFFNFTNSGTIEFGDRLFTGIKDVAGSVELPTASTLVPASLTVLSVEEEKNLATDQSFSISTIDSSRAPQLSIVTDGNDNPVLIGYELPGTTFTSPQLSASPIRRAAGTGQVINAQTTALAICMINPLLFNTSNAQKAQVVAKILTMPEFAQLVTLIESEIASFPSTYLDVDLRDGGIYEKAADITLVALQSFGTITPAPPLPNRFLERGILFGVDQDYVNDLKATLRIANWKTTQLVANLYGKTSDGWKILTDESTVIGGLGGILDKFVKVKLTLWPISKWSSELFAASAPNTQEFKGEKVDLRRGAYKLILYDTWYEEPTDLVNYYHAAVINSIDLSFMVVSLFMDVNSFRPNTDSQYKTILKAIFFNDPSAMKLLNIVRTKFRSIRNNIESGDTEKLIADIISLVVDGDALGVAIKLGLGRAASGARDKFIKMGSKVIFKSIAKKIGPGLIATGYDVANLMVFFADWVRAPNKRTYYLLDGFVWQTERELDHLSLYPENNRTVLPGQKFDLNKTAVVAHFTDGEMQGLKTGFTWSVTSGENSLEYISSLDTMAYTAPVVDHQTMIFTATYALDGDTRSTNLTVKTDGSLTVYPTRLYAEKSRVEVLQSGNFDLFDCGLRVLYSNGSSEVAGSSHLTFTLEEGEGTLRNASIYEAPFEPGGATIRVNYAENNIFKNCRIEVAVLRPPVVKSVSIPPMRLPLIYNTSTYVWETSPLNSNELRMIADLENQPARIMTASVANWKIISGKGNIWNEITATSSARFFQTNEAGDVQLEITYMGIGDYYGTNGTVSATIEVHPSLTSIWVSTSKNMQVNETTWIDMNSHDGIGVINLTRNNGPATALTGEELDVITFEDVTTEKITDSSQRGEVRLENDRLTALKPGRVAINVTVSRDFGIKGKQEYSGYNYVYIYPQKVPDFISLNYANSTEVRLGMTLDVSKSYPVINWQEDPESSVQNPYTDVSEEVRWQIIEDDGVSARVEVDGITLTPLHPGTPELPAMVKVQGKIQTFGVELLTPIREIHIKPQFTSAVAVPAEFTLQAGDVLDLWGSIEIRLEQSHGFPIYTTSGDYWSMDDGAGTIRPYPGHVYIAPTQAFLNYGRIENDWMEYYGLPAVKVTIHLPAPAVVEGGTLTFLDNPLRIANGLRTNMKFIQVMFKNPDGISKRVGGASVDMDFGTDYMRMDNFLTSGGVTGDGIYWKYDQSHAEVLQIAPVTVPNQRSGYDAAIQSSSIGTDQILVTYYENGIMAQGTLEVEFY